ncbi:hypothetical protein Aau02nite_48310 [Amorphoplanes auranticolor]|uniref:ANTAR domain-containing protein n=1 Tax=Actinoplanes auranticolor TaxID=47988 RepID=A0A919VQK1_9ACTN|nr:hypothetical protein Aau02nite_48310 [Actinoplanes auranticolor]
MAPGSRAARPGTAEARLTAAVRRLQAEVDGLRRAQHSRAVIEQAKGLLAGRLGCSPEEAFTQLSWLSQQSNIKVTEVAAGLLGMAVPLAVQDPAPQMTPAADISRRFARRAPAAPDPATAALPSVTLLPEETTARYHLTCAAMGTVDDVHHLAETIWSEGLRHLGATAVLIGVLEPDGAVRLVSTHGLPRSVASAWQRVPSTLNVAFLKAVSNGRPLWITQEQAAAAGYELLGDGDLRACLPLNQQGRIFGVASIVWARDFHPDTTTRAYVSALAEACGRRVSQMLDGPGGQAVASPAAHWVEAVLESLPGSHALLSPVRDAAGQVEDWRFDLCSPEAMDASGRTADLICGRRLLDLYPHASSAGLFDGYLQVLRTGKPFTMEPTPLVLATERHQIPVIMSVRASRFGAGLLVHWRYHDAERRLLARLERVQRLGDAGWAEWNLITGEVEWSAETYAILNRDPAHGPVQFTALHRYVAPEDRDILTAAAERLRTDHEPIDLVMRLHRNGVRTPVRLVADPVVDGLGRLACVDAAVRRLPDHSGHDRQQ